MLHMKFMATFCTWNNLLIDCCSLAWLYSNSQQQQQQQKLTQHFFNVISSNSTFSWANTNWETFCALNGLSFFCKQMNYIENNIRSLLLKTCGA